MKLNFAWVLSVLVSVNALAAPAGTKVVLDQIAQNADVTNGSSEVVTYKVANFDRDAELDKLNKNRADWRHCGPWKQTIYRRDGIAVVKSIDQSGTDQKLKGLYDQGQLKAMLTLKSNNDIACSLTFVEVYTTDGYQLHLFYSQGD